MVVSKSWVRAAPRSPTVLFLFLIKSFNFFFKFQKLYMNISNINDFPFMTVYEAQTENLPSHLTFSLTLLSVDNSGQI